VLPALYRLVHKSDKTMEAMPKTNP